MHPSVLPRYAEHADLTFQSVNASVNIGLAQSQAAVVDKEASRKIVAGIRHNIESGDDVLRIILFQPAVKTFYLDIGVEHPQFLGSAGDLAHPDFFLAVQHLPLQVADTHRVRVNETYPAHSRGAEVGRNGRAQTTGPYHQNGRTEQTLLALFAKFGQHNLPRIPFLPVHH